MAPFLVELSKREIVRIKASELDAINHMIRREKRLFDLSAQITSLTHTNPKVAHLDNEKLAEQKKLYRKLRSLLTERDHLQASMELQKEKKLTFYT